MARTRTVAEIRAEALEEADMENSDFADSTLVDRRVNNSMATLYGKLVQSRGDQYYRTPSAFTVSGGAGTVSLPTDFFKMCGVDLNVSSGKTEMVELPWAQRNHVEVLENGQTGLVWYVPHAPVLTSGQTFDGINGWERWVVLDVAIQLLNKEETDTTDLKMERATIEDAISALKGNRDLSSPGYTQDVRRMNHRAFYLIERSNLRLFKLSPELWW